jgi:hypothetical protein
MIYALRLSDDELAPVHVGRLRCGLPTPELRWDIHQVAAEGDLGVLHATISVG